MTEALDQTLAAIRQETDPVTGPHHERLVAFLDRIDQLNNRPQPGALAPTFSMPRAEGDPVTLSKLIANRALLLMFVRGDWCPFCSAQIAALAKCAPSFEKAGIAVAVVTPEVAGRALKMKREMGLTFEVLCDVDEGVALSYGCLFFVPPEEQEFLRNAGYDLAALYGSGGKFMPLASAFAIDRKGAIFAVYDRGTDQRKRTDPIDILSDMKAKLAGA